MRIPVHHMKEKANFPQICIQGELGWHYLLTTYPTPRKAEQVIAKHQADKPLFLYLSYQAPHMPFQGQDPPAKYMKMYKNKERIYQPHLREDRDAVLRAAAISVSF